MVNVYNIYHVLTSFCPPPPPGCVDFIIKNYNYNNS